MIEPDWHPLYRIGSVLYPLQPAHVGIFYKDHGEFAHFLKFPPFTSSQDQVTFIEGENSVGETNDITWLEEITFIAPQLEVNRSRRVSNEGDTHGETDNIASGRRTLVEDDEGDIDIVVGCRTKVLDEDLRRLLLG